MCKSVHCILLDFLWKHCWNSSWANFWVANRKNQYRPSWWMNYVENNTAIFYFMFWGWRLTIVFTLRWFMNCVAVVTTGQFIGWNIHLSPILKNPTEKNSPGPRVAELGSLSWGAKMAMKIFVKRVFTIFATNASFLRVIANLPI